METVHAAMAELIRVDEARTRIVGLAGRLEPRPVPLDDALRLVLSNDVVAGRTLPGFDNSAMDGFAVRAADTRGASEGAPVRLELSGEVAAGGAVPPAGLAPRCAIRVMTGAGMPAGADAVVEVERTALEGAEVLVRLEVEAGRSIRRAGDDIRPGDLALGAGTLLGPPQLALLAALGQTQPLCIPRPRVAVLATGDELVDPAVEPGPGQVTDIVSTAIAAAVTEAGGTALVMRRAADTEADVRRAFAEASADGADLVVSVGGVSMGEYDQVRRVMEAEGHLDFWRVAMRPGKPLAVGEVGGRLVVGLPGNPVSALVGFEVFVLPAITALSGRGGWARPRALCRLKERVDSPAGLRTFVRARVERTAEGLEATPLGGQGSHQLRAMASANALLDVAEEVETLAAGEPVTALLLDHPVAPAAG
ncbi:MAG: gephyrin-like molybdotransferase Glp [Candidatus Dormibacteria bacterium]